MIGLDRVHAGVLQCVSLDLLGQANATSLLRQVNQHSVFFAGDHLQSKIQLVAAIATQRAQQVTGKATGVHANQRSLVLFTRFTHHQSDRFLSFVFYIVGHDFELTVLGGQRCGGSLCDKFFAGASELDELFNRDDAQIVFFSDFEQFVPGRPVALLVQNFAKDSGRSQSGHTSQIDGRFGVTSTSQHATLFGHQHVNVSGTLEVIGFAVGVGDRSNAECSFFCRDTGPCRNVIEWSQKGGAVIAGVAFDQWRDLQTGGGVRQNRHAEVTATAENQVDRLWSRQFGGGNKVALVLAIFVVQNNHDFATPDRFNGVGDR